MVRFLGLLQVALFWLNLLSRFLGLIFGGEKVRIWTSIHQGNCSSILGIYVRLLNHPNQTSITQVMVHFSGLLQLRLFNGLCPDFGTVKGLVFLTEFKNILWFVMACCADFFCYGLLCGMFCGHLYATIGLEDEVVIA